MKRFLLAIASVAALVVSAPGCATVGPAPTEREGFFERISKADHSRTSNVLSRASRSPAARNDVDRRRAAIEVRIGQLAWPLRDVEITSRFGKRGKDFHEGVDLRAKSGTPVYSAQEGTVIYASNKIRGYGKLVVIRHYREISTVYAHNSRILVRTGQYVRSGQKIAISGSTGHSSGPHLHFEVRDGMAALDPATLIPDSKAMLARNESPFPIPPKSKKKEIQAAAAAKAAEASADTVEAAPMTVAATETFDSVPASSAAPKKVGKSSKNGSKKIASAHRVKSRKHASTGSQSSKRRPARAKGKVVASRQVPVEGPEVQQD